jgi:hypothetical protein
MPSLKADRGPGDTDESRGRQGLYHIKQDQEEGIMAKVTFDISMSLVGFITGPNEGVGNPLGDDGDRLHDWMFDSKAEADAEILDEAYATTGAILMGKANVRCRSGAVGRPSTLPDAGIRADPRVTRTPTQAGRYDLHVRDGGSRSWPKRRRAPPPVTRTSASGEARTS